MTSNYHLYFNDCENTHLSLLLSSKGKEVGLPPQPLLSGDNGDNGRNTIHLVLTVDRQSSKHLIDIPTLSPPTNLCSTIFHFTTKGREDNVTYMRLHRQLSVRAGIRAKQFGCRVLLITTL